MGGGSNSLLCCANGARVSGLVGCLVSLAHRKTSCDFRSKKIKGGELLLVVTNIPAPKNALCFYRKRWRIECLFADTKTRGFNIDDTHIIDYDKFAPLLAIVVFAMTWAYRCASQAIGRQGIRKNPTSGGQSYGSGSGSTYPDGGIV